MNNVAQLALDDILNAVTDFANNILECKEMMTILELGLAESFLSAIETYRQFKRVK